MSKSSLLLLNYFISFIAADTNKNAEEGLPKPKQVLFPPDKVQLGWPKIISGKVGTGMQNMVNTCYLNSTLQALFHVPAFANWLVSEEPHAVKCNQQGMTYI